MRMYRRSRCSVLLAVMVSVYLFLVLFSRERDPSLGFDPVSIRHALNKLVSRSSDVGFQQTVDRKAEFLLGEEHGDDNENRQLRFMMEMTNNEDANTVHLPPYITDPKNNENPHLQRFDPRFTFGYVLNHISRRLEERASLEDIEIPYFHWADWCDLTALDKHFLSKDKTSCSDQFNVATQSVLKNKKLELFEPTEYCIDDENIDSALNAKDTDPEFKEYLQVIKDSPYTSRWHVFGYSGRQKAEARILLARSYLNDFMPPPLSVMFLLPDDTNPFFKKPVQVKVNGDIATGRKKLMDTDAYSNHQGNNQVTKENGNEIRSENTVNVMEELSRLIGLVSNIQEQKYIQPTYEKVLQHSQFVDRSNDILKDLDAENNPGKREKMYRDSLRYSLTTAMPPKYFFEAKLLTGEPHSSLGGHYDWRFYNGIVNFSDHQSNVLYGLVKAWFSFTNANNITSWVAHGSLLSWYWNGYAFPWDYDIDVQVTMDDLHTLSRYYNQSVIVDLGSENNDEMRYGRYFLDCGSFISYRNKGNGNNNIDARLIDLDTGLYIDITALSLTPTKTPNRYRDLYKGQISPADDREVVRYINRNTLIKAYNCRNNHFATLHELSPLKLTLVEGQPAYVPIGFEQILLNEYDVKGISVERFRTYTFLPKLRIWVQDKLIRGFLREKRRASNMKHKFPIKELKDEDYLSLFEQQKKIMIEYLLTRKITSFHELELSRLSGGKTTEDLFFDPEGNFIAEPNNLRHDYFNYITQIEDISFEKEVEKILNLVKAYKDPDYTPSLEEPQHEDVDEEPHPQLESQQNSAPVKEKSNPNSEKDSFDPVEHMPVLPTQTDDHLINPSKNRMPLS